MDGLARAVRDWLWRARMRRLGAEMQFRATCQVCGAAKSPEQVSCGAAECERRIDDPF